MVLFVPASEAPLGMGGVVGATGAGAGALCALAAALAVRRRRRAPHNKPPPAAAHKQLDQHDDAEPDLIPNNYCEYFRRYY